MSDGVVSLPIKDRLRNGAGEQPDLARVNASLATVLNFEAARRARMAPIEMILDDSNRSDFLPFHRLHFGQPGWKFRIKRLDKERVLLRWEYREPASRRRRVSLKRG